MLDLSAENKNRKDKIWIAEQSLLKNIVLKIKSGVLLKSRTEARVDTVKLERK